MSDAFRSKQALLMLALLSAVLAAALLALTDERGRFAGARAPERQRTPAEAAGARSLQVIWFDSETGRSSYMIDASDGRLASIGAAVGGASPVPSTADEGYTLLLVFSFGAGDTMELAYAPGRNLLMAGDDFYVPAGDLSALLGEEASR